MNEGIIMSDGPSVKPMVKWLSYEPLHKAGGEPVIIQVPNDFQKIASQIHPEIQTFVADNPTPKNTQRIIVTALGAFDGYGSNVNGDGFYEKDLLKTPKNIYLGKNKYQKPMFKTFIDFARLYKMHRNKMHNHAYGEIPFNIYNKGMKRVENLLDIYEDDPGNADVLKTIKKGVRRNE